MKYTWKIRYQDFVEYKKHMKDKAHKHVLRKCIRDMAIAERAYYEGFKPARERVMFKEEIEDIEKVYEKVLASTEESLLDMNPLLLDQMQEFIDLHAKKEMVSKKLESLKVKLGKDKKEEGGDE